MNLIFVLLFVVIYWTIGCLLVSLNTTKDRAMSATILVLWPALMLCVMVYTIANLLLQIKKGEEKKE